MTLNEYIESLTQLRNHYNAGDFTVMTQDIFCEVGHPALDLYTIQEVYKQPIEIDGDDYHLNLEQRQLRIMTKGDGTEVGY